MKLTPDLVASCVDAVREGRLTIDECVAMYPAVSAELRAVLEISSSIVPPPFVARDPATHARGRAALLAAMAADNARATHSMNGHFLGLELGALLSPRALSKRQLPLPTFLFAVVLACTVLLGGGAVVASGQSLPGDVLYPIKLTVAQVELATAGSPDARAQVAVSQAADRLAEIQQAARVGRPEAIASATAAYVSALRSADAELANAASSGQDVSQLTTQIQSRLAQQRALLDQIVQTAPASERAYLVVAADAANNGVRSRPVAAAASPGSGASMPPTGTPTEVPPVRGGCTGSPPLPGGCGTATETAIPTATVLVATPTNTPTASATSPVATPSSTASSVHLEPTETEVEGDDRTPTPPLATPPHPPTVARTGRPSATPDEDTGDDENTPTVVPPTSVVPTVTRDATVTPVRAATALPNPTVEPTEGPHLTSTPNPTRGRPPSPAPRATEVEENPTPPPTGVPTSKAPTTPPTPAPTAQASPTSEGNHATLR